MDTVYRYFLNKLKKSLTFKKNDKYILLLNHYETMYYTNKIEDISEKTIAFDVLGKDVSFDPYYDSSVRVFLFRFKKQLKSYYLTEGINDDYILTFNDKRYSPLFLKCNRNRILGGMYPKKEKLEEALLFSLAAQFSMTNDVFYLDKIIEYFNSIDEEIVSNSPFIISIAAEAQINKFSLFNSMPTKSIESIEKDIEKANFLNKNDTQVIFTNIIHNLYLKDLKKVNFYSEQLEKMSNHPYYIGLSHMSRGLLSSDIKYVENIESFINKYKQCPPYWHIPSMLYSMRNNDHISATHHAQLFSYNNSFHSKIYLILLKAKTKNLSFEDEKYIADNEYFFSEPFLQNCIFELAKKYSLT